MVSRKEINLQRHTICLRGIQQFLERYSKHATVLFQSVSQNFGNPFDVRWSCVRFAGKNHLLVHCNNSERFPECCGSFYAAKKDREARICFPRLLLDTDASSIAIKVCTVKNILFFVSVLKLGISTIFTSAPVLAGSDRTPTSTGIETFE